MGEFGRPTWREAVKEVCVKVLDFRSRIGLGPEAGICAWVWDGAIDDLVGGETIAGDVTSWVAEMETFEVLSPVPCCGRPSDSSPIVTDRFLGRTEAGVGGTGDGCSSSLEEISIMGTFFLALGDAGSSVVKSMTILCFPDNDERGWAGFLADTDVVGTGSEARGRVEVVLDFPRPAD